MAKKYNEVTPEILEQFKAIVPGKVYAGEEINSDYFHDEMPIYGKGAPEVVIEATTTEDIAAIVKVCYENSLPVIPRGAGTGLTGAAVAVDGGVMIDMSKMNKILGYDLENFVVRVEPGVLLNDLAEDAQKQGLLYPPDPGEKFATLGGNVSTNAGGMRAVKYGCTRDYVRAMTVVLPTGEIVKLGATVSKTSTGYSLLNLMIGSEGTLCIATKLRMRVIPQPKVSYTLLVPYPSLEQCVGTVPKFINSDLNPTAIEYMPKSLLDEAAEYLNKIMPHRTADSYLILMFDGSTVEDVERRCDAAAQICLDNGAEDVFLCNTDERKEAVWTVRGASLEALKASTTDMDECDIVVPRNRIADFSKFAGTKMKETGIRISIQGHAGDGNMHIQLMRDDMDKKLFGERCPKLMEELYAQAKIMGGQVSGEHGIGHARVGALETFMGPQMIALYQAIKNAFDEKHILNPGKVIR